MRIDKADAHKILLSLGHSISESDLTIDHRETRDLVHAPGELVLVVPTMSANRVLLQKERKILGALRERTSLAVPIVLNSGPDESWQLRRKVAGISGQPIYQALQQDDGLSQRVGKDAAHILATLHKAVPANEALEYGLTKEIPSWLPITTIREKLIHHSIAPALKSRALEVVEMIEQTRDECEAPVFLHGDFGVHNMAFDPQSFELLGVFDFEESYVGDPHWDLKYLHSYRPSFVTSLLEAYSKASGKQISRNRVALIHAFTTVSFLASRLDRPANQGVAGRTLSQDLAWTEEALGRIAQISQGNC